MHFYTIIMITFPSVFKNRIVYKNKYNNYYKGYKQVHLQINIGIPRHSRETGHSGQTGHSVTVVLQSTTGEVE